jgi:hypothetical protein
MNRDIEWRNFRLVTMKGKVNPLYIHLTKYKIEPGRIGMTETMFPNRNERESIDITWFGFKNLKHGYWKFIREGKKYWQGKWERWDWITPLFSITLTVRRDLWTDGTYH